MAARGEARSGPPTMCSQRAGRWHGSPGHRGPRTDVSRTEVGGGWVEPGREEVEAEDGSEG